MLIVLIRTVTIDPDNARRRRLHWRPERPPARAQSRPQEEAIPHDVQAPERAEPRRGAGGQAGTGGGRLGRRARERRSSRHAGEGQRAARGGSSGVTAPGRPRPPGTGPPPGVHPCRAAAPGAAAAMQPLPRGRAVRHAGRLGGVQRARYPASGSQRPLRHPLPQRARRVRRWRAGGGRYLRRARRPPPGGRHGALPGLQPASRHARDPRHPARIVLLDPEPRAGRRAALAHVGTRRRDPAARGRGARSPRAGSADGRVPQPPPSMGPDLKPPLASIPPDVVAVADYEALARERMDEAAWAWLQGGAADELSLLANRRAFDRLQLLPRVLADMAGAHTRLELFGEAYEHPILLAPVAFQRLAHPEGELASVQAASAMQAGMVVSTQASVALETLARSSHSPLWFQLYIQPDREFTATLVRRAEASGCRALVVTVDAPVSGVRNREQRSGFALPAGVTAVNLQGMRALPPQAARAGESPLLASALVASAP